VLNIYSLPPGLVTCRIPKKCRSDTFAGPEPAVFFYDPETIHPDFNQGLIAPDRFFNRDRDRDENFQIRV